MAPEPRNALARLPSTAAILEHHEAAEAIATFGAPALSRAVDKELATVRERLRQGGPVPRADEILGPAAQRLAEHRNRRLRRVINATGVVLHGNLGRAPLSGAARAAVAQAVGYTPLEYDPDQGRHVSRTAHLGELAAEACGTEAALVVNNGAAALMLATAALAGGRSVVVSRGELIEIGENYRLPDVLDAAGARLREVGTTNRTRLADYRAAIGDDTALLLKVHRSNYRVVGFTEATSAAALGQLGREEGIPFVYDLGSGLLHDAEGPLAEEPSVHGAIHAGADLVVFSGDKLLGGPQAGVIAGRADLLLRCLHHPLARAVQLDKLRRGAMEATLEAHLRAELPTDVPVVAMLHTPAEHLRQRAEWMAAQLGAGAEAVAVRTVVGAGAAPGVEIDSWAVAVGGAPAERIEQRLRHGEVCVVARADQGRALLDLRTVPPAQDAELVDLALAALES